MKITGAHIIRQFLDNRGWTMRNLAAEAGVTHVTISNLLSGDKPSVDTLAALRRVRGLGGLQPEHFVNGDST